MPDRRDSDGDGDANRGIYDARDRLRPCMMQVERGAEPSFTTVV
jgi:hypothetical protein